MFEMFFLFLELRLTCNSPATTSAERPTSIDHRAAKSTVGGGDLAAPLNRVDNLYGNYL